MNLTPELWSRAKDLFEDALDLAPEARTPFLAGACPDNDFVRSEVEALLAEHELAGDFLESAPMPVFGLPLAAIDQPGTKVCPKCKTCFDGDGTECQRDGTALVFAFPGSRLIDNKYLVERQLGEGGMGMVYCAHHIGLSRRFAVKIMSTATGASRVFLERFELEARVLGKLKHPNIVDVTDYGVDPREGGMPYLVMEYLEGQTLEESCRRGPLPVMQSVAVLHAVAEAVDSAHDLGVLHGDLKPANVFLTKPNGSVPGAVKILDFGLARLTGWHLDDISSAANSKGSAVANKKSSGKSGAGALFGTPAYMAPELFAGETTNKASDIYSLGVIAYRLLTARLPAETLHEDGSGKLKPDTLSPSQVVREGNASAEATLSVAQIAKEMDAPVMAMLAKEPAQRPVSAVSAVVAIEKAWQAALRQQWIRREIPRRMMITIVLAPLLAGLALLLGHVGWVQDLEWKSEDFRFTLVPGTQPDPRIVMVSIDTESLADDPTPLSQRADEFSGRLEQIFGAGANRVALDVRPPPSWSSSQAFSRTVLRHADALTLALLTTSSGNTGSECVSGITAVALGQQRLSSLFAFVNLPMDADGKIRRAPFVYRDQQNAERATLAAAVTSGLMPQQRRTQTDEVRIDYRVDWRRIPRISWKELPGAIAQNGELFRNKVVLLGVEIKGYGDEHILIPGAQSQGISGLVLQTLIANTMIEPNLVGQSSALQNFLIAGSGCGLMFLAAVCLPNRAMAVGIAAGFSMVYSCMVWIVFRWAQMLIPVMIPLMAMMLGTILGMLVRQKLTAFPPMR